MPCATLIWLRALTFLATPVRLLSSSFYPWWPCSRSHFPAREHPKPAASRRSDVFSDFGLRPSDFLRISTFVLRILILFLVPLLTWAESSSPPVNPRHQFAVSRSYYQQNSNSVPAAGEFGRACFDLAEVATNHTEQAEIAQLGIEACRQATARDSNSAPAHYYLGMNLGKLAQTKGLGALKLVRQMEREFIAARELDEKIDYAGPDRNLGLLYRDAPSFGSVGNRTKARHHLQRAVVLAPDYADNALNLIEAYLNWGDHNSAVRELKALESRWSGALQTFSGPGWAAYRKDWETRLAKCRKKLQDAGRSLQSPRNA